MKSENTEILQICLAQLGLESRKDVVDRLLRYAEFTLAWNLKVNVVGTQDEGEFIVKHLADSLSAWTHFIPGKSIADVGSGGGLPGIPLAIALESPVTLVESKEKKAAFLSAAVKELGLRHVKVECRNANEVKGAFDYITSRAFSEMEHTLKITNRMAKAETAWMFYKGRLALIQEELAALKGWKNEVIPLTVPLLEGERHLVRVTRSLN